MDLLSKYNVPVPRYTSYPTVPHWKSNLQSEQWKQQIKYAFDSSNSREGISLYLHLPFCESLCTYCACNTRITVNHRVEEPYIEALLKEWSLYLELFSETPRLRELHLGGGTPTFFSAAHLGKLLGRLLEFAQPCAEHDFSFEAHPSSTSSAHLETLARFGFKRVSFGIQDFDPVVQQAINRYQAIEEVRQVVEAARSTGYESINMDLVYGLPFQNTESLRKTVEQVMTLRPERIAFYSYAHVPWMKPGQRKYTGKDLPADAVKRALYEEGRKIFHEHGYHEIGMDHFALESDALFKAAEQRSLHRNFMGYTPYHTRLLLGLGVSAISDAWTAFSQNIKTVEEYETCLKRNELPVLKGHLLSTDDLMLRRVILNIMCHLETSWNDAALAHAAFKKGLDKLKPLEADGLLELHPNFLRVTEKGKAFLRNICACFDEYYESVAGTKSQFSTAV
ncbi:MAG: oxygen-independent coproporphyrinogen III oxidase [Bacteroidia bacterium]